jgi:hypothetical protein
VADETASNVADETASNVADETASNVADETASNVADETASNVGTVRSTTTGSTDSRSPVRSMNTGLGPRMGGGTNTTNRDSFEPELELEIVDPTSVPVS